MSRYGFVPTISHQRFSSSSTEGRVQRLIVICSHLSNSRCDLWLPASRYRSGRLETNTSIRFQDFYLLVEMQSRLKIGFATFPAVITVLLLSVKRQLALTYIACIVSSMKTVEEHLKHPEIFVTLLGDADVEIELHCSQFSVILSIVFVTSLTLASTRLQNQERTVTGNFKTYLQKQKYDRSLDLLRTSTIRSLPLSGGRTTEQEVFQDRSKIVPVVTCWM